MRIPAAIFALALSGCAGDQVSKVDAVAAAGVTKYEDKIVPMAEGQAYGTEHSIIFGKEYETFSVVLGFDDTGEVKQLEVTAAGVRAFEGQQAAAMALVAVQEELARQNIALSQEASRALGNALRAAFGLP